MIKARPIALAVHRMSNPLPLVRPRTVWPTDPQPRGSKAAERRRRQMEKGMLK